MKKVIFILIAVVSIILLTIFIFSRTMLKADYEIEEDVRYSITDYRDESIIGDIIDYAKEIITTLSSLFGIVMAVREFRKGKKAVT